MGSWRRTHFSAEIVPEMDGQEVVVFGWVQDLRDLGGIKFLVLRDKEGTLQVTLPKKKVSEDVVKKFEMLRRESVVAVKGVVKAMPQAPRGVEVIPNEMRILSLAETPLPLDTTGRVKAELDTRLDARVLDLRTPESQAIFRMQHVVLRAIREFFYDRGFVEVITPKILATATEGGAQLFPVAYFEKTAFLAQSPQLYKEVLTSAFEKVFEIGSFFRAEESNTTYHLSEFVSVDVEVAFATAEDVMKLLEDLLVEVVSSVKKLCKKELEVLNHDLPDLSKPFRRFTYTEVLEILKEHGIFIKWGEDLPTIANRKLGELYPEPYFITEWPTELKPFYIMPMEDDPKKCYAFDLNWGWLELASGGTRIHKKDLLIERIKAQGLSVEGFKEHLMTFDYGMPPHAGWGLGLNRLMLVLTGRKNIREVVLFPRDRYRLKP